MQCSSSSSSTSTTAFKNKAQESLFLHFFQHSTQTILSSLLPFDKMIKKRETIFFLLIVLILSIFSSSTSALNKSYVVYLGGHSHGQDVTEFDLELVKDSHYNLLGSFIGSSENAKKAIFYSYTRYINGFAANMEEEEAEALSKHPNVVSVFENKGRKLHTTRSWQFLGLEKSGGVIPAKSIWKKARFGEDTIIGNLDTGVWPESESFSDKEYGPIPSRWRGICENNTKNGVPCNRKLIGARYFNKGYSAVAGPLNSTFESPRDIDGHGTHTLSTAGGNFVPGANIFCFGNGTAKGGSPRARVAAYKVCWPPVRGSECYDADIMAAFEAAIHDGVDVLSVSLGGDAGDYFVDGLSIGSFHAVKHGVVVVTSAGNSGPVDGSVSNVSPWMLTVGASTMDREFPSYVALGNRKHLKGESLSQKGLPAEKFYPLIRSSDAKAPTAPATDAQLCIKDSLDPAKVKGKIVVCLRGDNGRVDKSQTALQAGAVGMILANDITTGNEIIADAHMLPVSHITYTDGLAVYSYINSTKNPTAYLTQARTQLDVKPAPFMAAFSSKGPNSVTPEILKPDITAPGVSVIAAYTRAVGPTEGPDPRRVFFNSESGTSMSCPHISGIAGLLKTIYPDWSPAAIKSAIMTTAKTKDNEGHPIINSLYTKATPFSYGAGHVWPNHAMNPGLVYDLTTNDYLNFLCSLGYNATQIATFSEGPYKCPKAYSLMDFNYPSITVPSLSGSTTVTRRVKNVGSPGTYTVSVQQPKGILVSVKPKTLKFTKIGDEQIYKVVFKAKKAGAATDYVFGRLIWSDGKHTVRSSIVVKSVQKAI